MNTRYEIVKSRTPAAIQTVLIGIAALILFVVTSRIVRILDGFIPADTRTLGAIVRIAALVVAVLCVVVTWYRDKYKRYYIEDGSLVIQRNGLTGHSQQEVIRLKHSPNLKLALPFFGKQFGYGTITIEVDSYSQKSEHVLRYIEQPEKVLAELRARLK